MLREKPCGAAQAPGAQLSIAPLYTVIYGVADGKVKKTQDKVDFPRI